MARAIWHDTVIAESDDTVIVDGHTYFPLDSVDPSHLAPSDHTSVCLWKGKARYYDVVVNGATNRDAAWNYPTPSRAAAKIEGRIAFWRGVTIETDQPNQRPRLLDRFRRQPPSVATDAEGHHHDQPLAVADLNDATFNRAPSGQWTIVDFWAPWCGPCQAFHPIFDQFVARDTGDVRFARVNVDASPNTATAHNILSIPTIVLFDPEGNEVERLVGVPPRAELKRLVHLAVEATRDEPIAS